MLLAKKLSPELPEQIQEHPLVSAWTARMGAALLKRFKSCQKKIYQNRLAHIFDELYTAYYESGDAVLLVENQDDLVVQILDGLHLPDISMSTDYVQRHASSALNNLRILEAKLKEHGQQLTAEIVRQVCARKGKIPKEYQQLDLKRKDPAATDVDEEE